jgi:hypothetical protein
MAGNKDDIRSGYLRDTSLESVIATPAYSAEKMLGVFPPRTYMTPA